MMPPNLDAHDADMAAALWQIDALKKELLWALQHMEMSMDSEDPNVVSAAKHIGAIRDMLGLNNWKPGPGKNECNFGPEKEIMLTTECRVCNARIQYEEPWFSYDATSLVCTACREVRDRIQYGDLADMVHQIRAIRELEN